MVSVAAYLRQLELAPDRSTRNPSMIVGSVSSITTHDHCGLGSSGKTTSAAATPPSATTAAAVARIDFLISNTPIVRPSPAGERPGPQPDPLGYPHPQPMADPSSFLFELSMY